jgi:hypothetical protein
MVQEESLLFLIEQERFDRTPPKSSERSDEEHGQDGKDHVWHPPPTSCSRVRGSGFKGSGFRVQGSRVQGSGFRVPGIRVQGSKVQG